MKLVKHTNVVTLYQVIDTNNKLYLILELGTGGDLYDFIQKKHPNGMKEKKDLQFAKKIFLQIVNAIKYCHDLHIVHRDLKPENIVFFAPDLVKLTDFGLSANCRPGQKLLTLCGSLEYSAPEIFFGESYDGPAVDVWSMGVLLYMMLVGKSPFAAGNDNETLINIMDEKYYTPDYIPDACKRLLKRMIVREVHNRCTVSEILTSDWLSDVPLSKQMPLIAKVRDLSKEDKLVIIQQMEEGNFGSKDAILKHITEHPYSHLSATYYILAEKFLRRKQAFNSSIRKKKVSYQDSVNSSGSEDDVERVLQRKHEFSSPSGPSPLPTVFETKRGAAEIGVLRKRNLELIPSVPSSRNKDNNNVDNNLWAKPVREVSIKESNSFRSPTKNPSPVRDNMKVIGRLSLPPEGTNFCIPEIVESDVDTLSGADDTPCGTNLSSNRYMAKSIPSLQYPQPTLDEELSASSDNDLSNLTEIAFGPDLIPSRDDLTLPSRPKRPPSENPIRRMSSGDMDEELHLPGSKGKRKRAFFKPSNTPADPKYKWSNDKGGKKPLDTRKELHLQGAIGTDPARRPMKTLSTCNPGFERIESPVVIKVQSQMDPLVCPSTPKSKSYPTALSHYNNEPISPATPNGNQRPSKLSATTSDTILSHNKRHRIRCCLL
eukprot:TRINITY_DN1645_c0_g1_i2.p1 TRINITY_DN1645_c0_g1~~TRINITY_DN1645_c0_g1_i2.p1  ORF type:complete len:657 (-),score=153.19 TRINITY_DN1645_c0_g1_i2:129-2099(-)